MYGSMSAVGHVSGRVRAVKHLINRFLYICVHQFCSPPRNDLRRMQRAFGSSRSVCWWIVCGERHWRGRFPHSSRQASTGTFGKELPSILGNRFIRNESDANLHTRNACKRFKCVYRKHYPDEEWSSLFWNYFEYRHTTYPDEGYFLLLWLIRRQPVRLYDSLLSLAPASEFHSPESSNDGKSGRLSSDPFQLCAGAALCKLNI